MPTNYLLHYKEIHGTLNSLSSTISIIVGLSKISSLSVKFEIFLKSYLHIFVKTVVHFFGDRNIETTLIFSMQFEFYQQ
jgi:hypothetical protein